MCLRLSIRSKYVFSIKAFASKVESLGASKTHFLVKSGGFYEHFLANDEDIFAVKVSQVEMKAPSKTLGVVVCRSVQRYLDGYLIACHFRL